METDENDNSEDDMMRYIMDGLEIMKKFRGEVIEKSLQLDHILDDIISNYFSKESKKKNDQFRSLLLDSRYTTSFRKIKIFQELKLHKDPIFKNRFDGLSGRLICFNEARDDFAHLTRETYHHQFTVRWKGKKENKDLDDAFKKEIEDEFQYLITSLFEIAHEFGLLLNWRRYEERHGDGT